jgi:pimeloyl-ACP methyl ester carboxylesterase
MTTTPDPLSRFALSEVHRTTVAGISIAYRDIGAGPTVLLLHGWPMDGSTFARVVDALADDYRFVVPDLPGAGETAWDRGQDLTPAGLARIMAAFLDRLGIDRTLTVIGNDSGGMVARWLADSAGPLVTRLVLLNTEIPGHRAPFQRRSRLLARWLPGYTSIARRQLRDPRFLISPAGFGGTLHDHELLLGTFRERYLDPLAASTERMDDARRSFISLLDWRQLDGLAAVHRRIAAPTWFLWGRDDPTFPIAPAKRMFDQFPNTRDFLTVERARLYVQEDRPDEVIRHLQVILADPLP